MADGRAYHVLLASITYFKAEPGDEVAIVIPRDIEMASWCAIENILQKGSMIGMQTAHAPAKPKAKTTDMEHWKQAVIDTPAPAEAEPAPAEVPEAPTTSAPVAPEETPATPEETAPAATESTPVEPLPTTIRRTQTPAETISPDDAEAERLRQEIIDEWLKDTSTTTIAATDKA